MTVRIAEEENCQKAFEELINNYVFVGLVDKFNESLVLLSKVLGFANLHPFYEKINEGNINDKIIFNNLSIELQNKILKNNEQDIELYQNVVNILYPEQLNKLVIKDDLLQLEKRLKNLEERLLAKEGEK